MYRLTAGTILESKSGRRCAIIFDNNLKYDLLFSRNFQMRDVPLINILREYRFIETKDRIIDAIEEILDV